MSILGSNKNKLPIIGAGLEGMNAFRELIRQNKMQTAHPASNPAQTNKLFVTYIRSKSGADGVKAQRNTVWYHADIQHYDATGHLNTGKTSFLVSIVAEKQNGEDAVKAELNQIVATKMKAVIDLHKNS